MIKFYKFTDPEQLPAVFNTWELKERLSKKFKIPESNIGVCAYYTPNDTISAVQVHIDDSVKGVSHQEIAKELIIDAEKDDGQVILEKKAGVAKEKLKTDLLALIQEDVETISALKAALA